MNLRCSTLVWAVMLGCGGGGGGEITGPGPGPGPSAPSASASVAMRSQDDAYGYLTHEFVPSSVTVSTGGTVVWTNPTGQLHNVTFSTAGAPQSIGDHSGGTNSRVFPSAGTFNYSCTNHAGMTGRVTVQ